MHTLHNLHKPLWLLGFMFCNTCTMLCTRPAQSWVCDLVQVGMWCAIIMIQNIKSQFGYGAWGRCEVAMPVSVDVDQLLGAWAEWRVRDESGGLGWKTSSLGRSGGGGGRQLAARTILPAGVDADAVMSAVDTAYCKLPVVQQVAVDAAFIWQGDEGDRLVRLGVGKTTYFKWVREAKAALTEVLMGVLVERVRCPDDMQVVMRGEGWSAG